jgi:clan AA aspartic protease (TIGR02281 family)
MSTPLSPTRVGQAENARRRAIIWSVSKSVFWGGVGIGALCFGASFLVQPKIIETTKVVEKPVIVEKQVVVYKDAPKDKVASQPETHPWDELVDKHYEGIITDANGNRVCFDHNLNDCARIVVTDHLGHATLDASGNMIDQQGWDYEPMRKWIGYSAYSAAIPTDPMHLRDFWVANKGVLIKFEMRQTDTQVTPRGLVDSVALHTNDGGQSLFIDANLGTSAYSFQLDTGASDMTVSQTVAARLLRDAHAVSGPPETVTLADGSEHTVQSITINTVTVGTHRVSDVHATISPDSAPMLLGMGVLNRIGRFTVDAPNRQLTFNGVAS